MTYSDFSSISPTLRPACSPPPPGASSTHQLSVAKSTSTNSDSTNQPGDLVHMANRAPPASMLPAGQTILRIERDMDLETVDHHAHLAIEIAEARYSLAAATNYLYTHCKTNDPEAAAIQKMSPQEVEIYNKVKREGMPVPLDAQKDWIPISEGAKQFPKMVAALDRMYDTEAYTKENVAFFYKAYPDHIPILKTFYKVINAERDASSNTGVSVADFQEYQTCRKLLGNAQYVFQQADADARRAATKVRRLQTVMEQRMAQLAGNQLRTGKKSPSKTSPVSSPTSSKASLLGPTRSNSPDSARVSSSDSSSRDLAVVSSSESQSSLSSPQKSVEELGRARAGSNDQPAHRPWKPRPMKFSERARQWQPLTKIDTGVHAPQASHLAGFKPNPLSHSPPRSMSDGCCRDCQQPMVQCTAASASQLKTRSQSSIALGQLWTQPAEASNPPNLPYPYHQAQHRPSATVPVANSTITRRRISYPELQAAFGSTYPWSKPNGYDYTATVITDEGLSPQNSVQRYSPSTSPSAGFGFPTSPGSSSSLWEKRGHSRFFPFQEDGSDKP